MDKRTFVKGLGAGMFSIFGETIKVPKEPYSLFTGSPKQLKSPERPTASGAVGGVGSAIIEAFSRIPVWFNNALLPAVNPVVETSLYWPLDIQLKFQSQLFTGAGTYSAQMVVRPPKGRHWLITSLWYQHGAIAAASEFLALKLINASDDVNANGVSIGFYVFNAHNFVPIINAQNYIGTSAGIDPANQVGRKSLYLPNSLQLVFQITTATSPTTCQFEMSYLDLPENQPFGNLIGAI